MLSRCLVLIMAVMLTSCSTSGANRVENVSYQSVLSLPDTQPAQVFEYGVHEQQFAEFWSADRKTEGAAPLLVFIHGGCWLNAYDIAHSRAMSAALANQGFNVWSLEYRRTGDEGGAWPGTFDDILLALRFLAQENPANLDLSRVTLIGHSAGGHLALLAAAYQSSLSISLDRVVGLAAISNLTQYAEGSNSCQKAALTFMTGNDDDPNLSYTSPDYNSADPNLLTPHPRTVLLHGDKDSIVPVQQALESGREYTIIEGAGHFDFLYPGTEAFNTLLRTLSAN